MLIGHQAITVLHQHVTGICWQAIPPVIQPRPTFPHSGRIP
jgi:hypothetical protein